MSAVREMPVRSVFRQAGRWGVQGLLILLLSVGLLGVFELGLRIGGLGYSTRFFLKKESAGRPYLVTNKAFYQQFFTLPIDDMWEASEWEAPAHKAPGTYRVVILGSSAARGWPEAAFSFWRMIDVLLRTRYPGVHFEVYCAAHPGVNSHVMRVAARACARLEPDLYVVYMGNNEVNGPFGASDPRLEKIFRSTAAIQAKIAATDLRMLQLLTGHRQELWRASLEAIENYFPLEDPRLELVYRHFQENLEAICDSARDAGAPVLLCSVGANLRDWFPQKSLHKPGLSPGDLAAWETQFSAGKSAEEGARYAEAAAAYQRALMLDGAYAEAHFRLGSCYWALGDYEKARTAFEAACDHDAFRSRAYSRIDEVIRDVAQSASGRGVYFTDARRALMEESPNGVAGRDFFCDACHLTFEGNYVLARAVFEQISAVLPTWVRERQAAPEVLSLDACKERLGFSPPAEANVLRNILFQSASWHWHAVPGLSERLAELEKEAGPEPLRTEADAYARALGFFGTDRVLLQRYTEDLLKLGDAPRALETAEQLVKLHPCRRDTHRLLGMALARSGRFDDAVCAFRDAVGLYPDDAESCFEMASALEQQGKAAEALGMYRRTLSMDANHERAKCGEAAVLEKQGRTAEALRAYREAILIHPNYYRGFEGYDALLLQQHDPMGRVRAWRAVLQEAPKAARAYLHLGMSLEAVSDLAGAAEAYRHAVENDALDPAMQGSLGSMLLRQGQAAEAVKPLREAVRLNPHAGQFWQDLLTALLDSGDVAGAKGAAEECGRLGIELPEPLRGRL